MAYLTYFPFEFFYVVFTEDSSQDFLYHDAKSQKWLSRIRQSVTHYHYYWSSLVRHYTTMCALCVVEDLFSLQTCISGLGHLINAGSWTGPLLSSSLLELV